MALFGKMSVLFIYMLLGYICFKRKYLDVQASKIISFIVLNIASPALMISGAVNRTGEVEGGLTATVVSAILMYVVLIVLALFLPYVLLVPKEKIGVYRLMTIFSNIGFMGFPVLQAMYGDQALLQAAIFQLPFNVLIYTYGIYEITKNRGGDKAGFQWKEIINVGMIASLLTIGLYLAGVEMPQFFKETVSGLGELTAPLSMIVIGMALAQIPIKNLFTDVRLLIFSAIKLLLIPIVGVTVAKHFVTDTMLVGVIMVMIATPVGSMTAMLAQQYDGDIDSTSKGVALTTLLSVVTIPLVSMIVL